MNLRHTIVSRLDREMPRAMSTMRYAFHVGLRGKVVYPKVTRPIFKILGSEACVAVDVGANVGVFTRYLSSHFKTCHSFEPLPDLADRLSRSAPSNCRVHDCAVGAVDGGILLRIPVDRSGREMHALSTAAEDNKLDFFDRTGVVERRVRQVRLDTALAGEKPVAFVKINVEGFETAVLRGAKSLLADQRPFLLIEISMAHNPGYRETLAILEAAGYRFFAITESGLEPGMLSHILDQPLSIEFAGAKAAPNAQWDFLFVPEEKLAAIAGLVD